MTTVYPGLTPRQRPHATPAGGPFPLPPPLQQRLADARAALAAPFTGITTDGHVVPGLFPIQRTGVSTRPIQDAARAFLAALTPEQQAAATFEITSDAWRSWSNIHPYLMRHGVGFEALTPEQRDVALALVRETLSPAGFDLARDIMKLNWVIGDITGKWDEYGEWYYWLSIMGTPSDTEPWGWQLDGHHLNVNCFILGDQLVLTPTFMGSEPCWVDTGRHAGTRVFQAEEQNGLRLVRALTSPQRGQAILGDEAPGECFTAAFRDNFELRYEGIRADALTADQQTLLLDLIGTYIGRMRPGHAAVKLTEVQQHLPETYFAWIGGTGEDSVFYYRVHSPVLLIEFDHQRGLALDDDRPTRQHIHTVVRTPNGNDYGKDLLRQHYARFDHARPAAAYR